MSAGSLGRYYLEFGVKGKEDVDKAIDGVEKKLKATDKAVTPIAQGLGQKIATAVSGGIAKIGDTGKKLGASLAGGLGGVGKAIASPFLAAGAVVTAPFKAATAAASGFAKGLLGPVAGAVSKLGEQLKAVGQAATVPFALASASVLGFVRAGLSGTTMGERLGLQFQLLNREIASLFLPVIERVIGAVQRVTDWFRSLSGEQQESIGRWVTFGVAALGVAAVLPRIIGGLQGVATLFAVLNANPFVAVVAGLAAFLVGTEQGRSSLAELWDALQPIGAALAGIAEVMGGVLLQAANALRPAFEVVGLIISGIATAIKTVVQWIIAGINAIRRLRGLEAIQVNPNEVGAGSGGRGQNRHELANTSRGPEGFQASWTRFQTASLRGSEGNIPQQQLNVQQQQLQALQQIQQQGGRPQMPPIA